MKHETEPSIPAAAPVDSDDLVAHLRSATAHVTTPGLASLLSRAADRIEALQSRTPAQIIKTTGVARPFSETWEMHKSQPLGWQDQKRSR